MAEYLRRSIPQIIVNTATGPEVWEDFRPEGGFIATSIGVIVDWSGRSRDKIFHRCYKTGLTFAVVQVWEGINESGHVESSAGLRLTGSREALEDFIQCPYVLRADPVMMGSHAIPRQGTGAVDGATADRAKRRARR